MCLFLRLASQSLWSRRGSVLLTYLAIMISVLILLAVEHIRYQVKDNFNNTVSGVDLIVGARTGEINLLLYSVFRIGSATQNIDWKSYEHISQRDEVEWAIPISLGDSHKGYRVVGTTQDYFSYFQYGQQQSLNFAEGRPFDQLFDVVLGAEVARTLGYELGSKIVLAHGMAQTSFSLHDDAPFTVVGILEPTGTPVDRSLHVSLGGIEAIHMNWQNGVKLPGKSVDPTTLTALNFTPTTITAVMLGLHNKIATFRTQRAINTYQPEALSAIIPGVTLTQLWQIMSGIEKTLTLISFMVLLAALLGLAAMLLTSIRERLREIAVLRALGVGPILILLLIELEAVLITSAAIITAVLLLTVMLLGAKHTLVEQFGLVVSNNIMTADTLWLCLLVLLCALFIALIPAFTAYTKALHSRLTYN